MTTNYKRLTDKELLETLQELRTECNRRGYDTREKAAIIIFGLTDEELEKAKEERMKAALEDVKRRQIEKALGSERKAKEEQAARDKVKRAWERKAKIAKEVQDIVGQGFSLNVWKRGSDKRVYLNGSNTKYCYYDTGNRYEQPDTIEYDSDLSDEEVLELKAILRRAAQTWTETRFSIDSTANYLTK